MKLFKKRNKQNIVEINRDTIYKLNGIYYMIKSYDQTIDYRFGNSLDINLIEIEDKE